MGCLLATAVLLSSACQYGHPVEQHAANSFVSTSPNDLISRTHVTNILRKLQIRYQLGVARSSTIFVYRDPATLAELLAHWAPVSQYDIQIVEVVRASSPLGLSLLGSVSKPFSVRSLDDLLREHGLIKRELGCAREGLAVALSEAEILGSRKAPFDVSRLLEAVSSAAQLDKAETTSITYKARHYLDEEFVYRLGFDVTVLLDAAKWRVCILNGEVIVLEQERPPIFTKMHSELTLSGIWIDVPRLGSTRQKPQQL